MKEIWYNLISGRDEGIYSGEYGAGRCGRLRYGFPLRTAIRMLYAGQIFYTMEEVPDLEDWWGKESGISSGFGHLLEESDKYTVTYENMGHYGFQYMDGNTDFDILKVNITEETGND